MAQKLIAYSQRRSGIVKMVTSSTRVFCVAITAAAAIQALELTLATQEAAAAKLSLKERIQAQEAAT